MKKNSTFFQSVKCAVKGAVKGFYKERNFLIYVSLVVITLPINIWLCLSKTEILILSLCVCGAFSSECFNTAIEKICDKIEKNDDEIIGYIKDISAAGVLWWGIAYFGAEIFLILEKVIG